MIRGYHVYQNVWEPQMNETLNCKLEPTNEFDKHAVSEVKSDVIVGQCTESELETVCVLYS